MMKSILISLLIDDVLLILCVMCARHKHRYIDAWLNCDILFGVEPSDFIRSINKAMRITRDRQKSELFLLRKRQTERDAKRKGKGKATTEASVDDSLSDVEAGTKPEEMKVEEQELPEDFAREINQQQLDEHLRVGLSFKDSASLLLQLAYILQKSRRWVHHSLLRVNFLYSNPPRSEFDDTLLSEAIESKLREFCDTIRVKVNVFRTINVDIQTMLGQTDDADVEEAEDRIAKMQQRAEAAQLVLENYSDQSIVSFVPLQLVDDVDESNEAHCKNYCRALQKLTQHLPPTFLVKFGENKDVVTNAI